jgi:hypothetical protein
MNLAGPASHYAASQSLCSPAIIFRGEIGGRVEVFSATD